MVRVVEDSTRYGRDNKSTDIWRESRNLGDMWHRAVVTLPPIKNWYIQVALDSPLSTLSDDVNQVWYSFK